MSLFWLTPQFFLLGVENVTSFPALLEFFNSEAPRGMKSIATALFWCVQGLASLLATFLVQAVNRATRHGQKGGWLEGTSLNSSHLDWFYWVVAAVAARRRPPRCILRPPLRQILKSTSSEVSCRPADSLTRSNLLRRVAAPAHRGRAVRRHSSPNGGAVVPNSVASIQPYQKAAIMALRAKSRHGISFGFIRQPLPLEMLLPAVHSSPATQPANN
ncbi:hypothetical protein HU200_032357 [Digitaria exilis]|uniref:Uncharacterized protein n=1 Tax=Digitaria exilis TaxID=1010633 RepID=A0A835ESJ8_9POAL|nr:hypothetical protein HU200_032357 [Digitaria exilis]